MTIDTMAAYSRRTYRKPPVVEAVARLHWRSAIEWKFTTPGLLYDRVRTDYPGEPQLQNLVQAGLNAEANAAPSIQVVSGPARVMFSSTDACRLLSVTSADFSVHGLPPYEGWESLETRLFSGLALLDDAAPEPVFDQVSLRYINRIEIPLSEFAIQDYMTIGFAMPPGWPPQIVAFMDRVESVYPDRRSKISFTWATAEAIEGSSAFIVDLDLTSEVPEGTNAEGARALLKQLKERETQAFESLLQDSLRELFDEIK